MPRDFNDYRHVGTVAKPHGLRGAFHLFMESDFPDWLAARSCFYADVGNKLVSWKVLEARFQNTRLILRVDGLPGRNEVEAARGTHFYVPEAEARQALVDPDFFFNSDLVGLNLVDETDSTCYGQVCSVIDMPGQNLLEVAEKRGKTFLFPFSQNLVKQVDLQKGELRVIMPEGLTDL